MARILVTGAYGFLGKYVIEELVSHGYDVLAFGRDEQKMKALKRERVDIFIGDFCNKEAVIKATEGVDAVIHCGALSTIWGKREDFIDANVRGTMNLVEGCLQHQVKRFVYVSSPSIYARKANRLDIKETDVDESNTLNFYIESKILAEQQIKATANLDWVIVRPRGLFGVGDPSIVPRLIRANAKIGIPLFNNGRNIVDMTCVENVAYALRLCLESPNAVGNIYNITNGEPKPFKGILETLFNSLGVQPNYLKLNSEVLYALSCLIERLYKIFRIYKEPIFTKYSICTLAYSQTLDISKARNELNYVPQMTLQEGIMKYAEQYNKA